MNVITQKAHNNLWNEIEKRIIIPEITNDEIKSAISSILSNVTIISYHFEGDEQAQKLCELTVQIEDSETPTEYYSAFYDKLKDWFIVQYSLANPHFADSRVFHDVFLEYLEAYFCEYLNNVILVLERCLSSSEWFYLLSKQ